MIEKRFTVFKSKLTGLFVVNDNTHKFHFEGVESASTIMKLVGLLNNYIEENEQLKTRNDRQAKQLAELYELMAKKDWESLTEIIDDFCSCEEQLQRESGTYGGFE